MIPIKISIKPQFECVSRDFIWCQFLGRAGSFLARHGRGVLFDAHRHDLTLIHGLKPLFLFSRRSRIVIT